VQALLEIPAVEVGNSSGAEACPGKNQLAIHAVSLSKGARPVVSPPRVGKDNQ
jgi:hypothetical protein